MLDGAIPWGLDATGTLKNATDVPRGLACSCFCPKCKAPLEACQGPIVRWYFRHASETGCRGAGETALHMFAKETIRHAATKLRLVDSMGALESVEIEPWLDGVRPDALLHCARGDIAVEIWVEHKAEAKKIKVFADRDLNAMEIDLRAYHGGDYTEIEWRAIILTEARRYWLHAPRSVRPQPVTARPYGWGGNPVVEKDSETFTEGTDAGSTIYWSDDATPEEKNRVRAYAAKYPL